MLTPISFRIKDFRSIEDSGECALSADGITVLAGQNESGKTAVLSALRDFDLPEGQSPISKDFLPEGRDGAPSVSVRFRIEQSALKGALRENGYIVHDEILAVLESLGELRVTRDFVTNKYTFEPDVGKMLSSVRAERSAGKVEGSAVEQIDPAEEKVEGVESVTAANAGVAFRQLWPMFVYFDSFQDTLPRDIAFSDIAQPPAEADKPAQRRPKGTRAVEDFISLSGLDLKKVSALAADNKALGNYLRRAGASITGDFLTYWKQVVQGNQSVDLHVRHFRTDAGELRLAFYVHDGVDQYPDQRSKGFLWFLSFYLRLAAAHKDERGQSQLLLIDEPGTYLHARAQKDVLHLFEDRLVRRDLILYSTHSTYLMPPDRLHRLRIVIKHGKDGTKVLDKLTHPLLRSNELFSDTLSPILAAIGLDIAEQLKFVRNRNLLVEGISDYFYVTSFARISREELMDKVNVFPGSGATTLPVLSALFVGWGLSFAVLLDRDNEGNKVKDRFIVDHCVPNSRIVQPQDGLAIEDVFSQEDFRSLLRKLDPDLTLESSERPTNAIKRLKIDKVLLARTFAEHSESLTADFTKKTRDAITKLLDGIEFATAA